MIGTLPENIASIGANATIPFSLFTFSHACSIAMVYLGSACCFLQVKNPPFVYYG